LIRIDNNFKICFDASLIDVADWSNFVEDNEYSNIFHTVEFYQSFKAYPSYQPTPIFILNQRNAICGLIMLIVYAEKENFIGKITTRAISYDYPLLPQALDVSKVIGIIKRKYARKLIHWNLVPFKASSMQKKRLLDAGFVYEPHLNFIFDLSVGETALLGMISKTRRKQIRRAERRGVKISIHKQVSDFSSYYKILSQTYREAGLPLFNKDYFTNILNGLTTKQVLVIEASVEDKIIGFRLVLLHKNYMYDFYAGSDKTYYSYYPNDLLVWETLKFGVNNGFKIFNFGGAGHPDKKYGVRDFKKSFGGELVNTGVFRLPINNMAFAVIRLIKKLRGR